MANVLEKEVTVNEAGGVVATTSETPVITGRVRIPTATARVLVKAWAQLTTGTGTTAITTRIRDGATVLGTIRNEGNTEQIQAPAGSTEQLMAQTVVQVQNRNEYSACMTLQQTGASADGTCVYAFLELEVLNG